MLRSFCSGTKLHGFGYIVQPTRHKVERVFWFFSVLSSFILTGLLIRKLVLESQKNPIVIYKDQNVVRIEELNFPAVSICPGLIYKTPCRTHIDYDKIKSRLLSHELNITQLSMKELKMLQIISLVARDEFLSDFFPNLTIPMDDYKKILLEFNQTFGKHPIHSTYPYEVPESPVVVHNFLGSYANLYNVMLKRSDSQFGPCFSFNSVPHLGMYHVNNTDINFLITSWRPLPGLKKYIDSKFIISSDMRKIQELPVTGTTDDFTLLNYPQTLPCMHKRKDYFFLFKDAVPRSNMSGYHVAIHDPFEVISTSSSHFTWKLDQKLDLEITPELTRIDESLTEELPEFRNCYLPHERKLKFFKVYNKANCEHECWAEKTLESCGCVQYFMARNRTTKACGTDREKCFRQVEREFESIKSSCLCYDPCDNVNYKIKLLSTESNDHPAYGIRLSVKFADDSVYATRRRNSYTVVDFLSYFGGLLGLFAGFSILSGAEILYYFIVVPLTKLKRRRQIIMVHPIAVPEEQIEDRATTGQRVWKLLQDMLKSSSIHTFNQIGSDGRKWIDRVSWFILFISSVVTACWTMRNVFVAYQNNQIIMKFESTPQDLTKIPFPALTITRGTVPSNAILAESYLVPVCVADQNYCQNLIYELVDQYNHEPPEGDFKYRNNSDHAEMLRMRTGVRIYPFKLYSAMWNRKHKLSFAEVLTFSTMGVTFNIIEHSKLLNNKSISYDFRYHYRWNNTVEFPLTTGIGDEKGLFIDMDTWSSRHAQYTEQYYIIHPSNELPINGYPEGIKKGQIYDIFITPEIVKADDELKTLSIETRKCYFDGERKLKFYKVYTQRNCENECRAYVTYSFCTCVPFYYIRGNNNHVCNTYSIENCIDKLYKMTLKRFDYLHATNGVCNCLPTCNSVKYSYEIYKSYFHQNFSINRNVITMRWKDSEYYAMTRFQEFKRVDFFSYVGGISGLFAGISVLSVFELFYFLTLRFVNDLLRFSRGL